MGYFSASAGRESRAPEERSDSERLKLSNNVYSDNYREGVCRARSSRRPRVLLRRTRDGWAQVLIRQGEIVSLIGRKGSGKTATISMA
jgi:ABC-type glutathione transport system ATPase component